MNPNLDANVLVPQEALDAFCRRSGIRKLAFFGSALRGDFRADSDVDVLVEFDPGQSVGFFRMAELEIELGALLGRRVDLRTPSELSRYFRDDVIRTSDVRYVRVWDTVTHDLPPLIASVSAILSRVEDSQETVSP